MDVPVFAAEYYDEHGYGRPVYTLCHDIIFIGPTGDFFKKIGFISANHENADEALRSGGLVVVFPGGDYDVYRPTLSENEIDFDGRTGYVRAALNAGVPIVPTVAIGGQETPALPVPRRVAGQAPRPDTPGPRQDRADFVRIPVRVGLPCSRSTSRCRRRSSCRCCRRSTSSPSSARTPTSTRSTLTSGTSCNGRSTNSPRNARLPVLG